MPVQYVQTLMGVMHQTQLLALHDAPSTVACASSILLAAQETASLKQAGAGAPC